MCDHVSSCVIMCLVSNLLCSPRPHRAEHSDHSDHMKLLGRGQGSSLQGRSWSTLSVMILMINTVSHPRGGDGCPIRQRFRHTGQASPLGCGISAGPDIFITITINHDILSPAPVFCLHPSPACDQVLPDQGVHTVGFDSGPKIKDC